MKKFSKDSLPEGEWKTYWKNVVTRAVRVDGPFMVETAEGVMMCKEGYLALDVNGCPYPISLGAFKAVYVEVDKGDI